MEYLNISHLNTITCIDMLTYITSYKKSTYILLLVTNLNKCYIVLYTPVDFVSIDYIICY